jgi:hypothetical protein
MTSLALSRVSVCRTPTDQDRHDRAARPTRTQQRGITFGYCRLAQAPAALGV